MSSNKTCYSVEMFSDTIAVFTIIRKDSKTWLEYTS